jgi:hypothetical protein
MATDSNRAGGRVRSRLRNLVYGREDPRLRATYRVLLAMPVFWLLAGGVLAGNLQARIGAIPTGGEPLGGLAASLLHGGFVLLLLLGWTRYVDRRPLSDYGVSATPSWVVDLLGGLGAILAAFALWFGVAVGLGWATVDVAASAPRWSLPAAIAVYVGALGIHALIQQVVFFRIVLGNAAEGLHSRGLDARRAALAGLLAAVPVFVAIHEVTLDLRLVDLAVVGLVYGLLYVHTGSLAYGTGLHLGTFVAAGVLFVPASATADSASLLAVTSSLPASVAVLGEYGFPKVLLAYAFLLALLAWRHGGIPVEADVARWASRSSQMSATS